jgi:hypothetical protein
MLDRVYIETLFVSYLTARPNRDLIVAANQQLTHEWWDKRRNDFEMCVSELVLDESGAGDPEAAQERLEILKGMTLLDTTDEASRLAEELVAASALPVKSAADGLHIAVAAVCGISFLLTWNCRHLANATMWPLIDAVCTRNGRKSPIICTPGELMGTNL